LKADIQKCTLPRSIPSASQNFLEALGNASFSLVFILYASWGNKYLLKQPRYKKRFLANQKYELSGSVTSRDMRIEASIPIWSS
jgi:hypothetical protein